MDVARPSPAIPTYVKMAVTRVIDLPSDAEEDLADAIASAKRVDGVTGLEALDAFGASGDEGEADFDDNLTNDDEEWELASSLEETLEELGDESLAGGGG